MSKEKIKVTGKQKNFLLIYFLSSIENIENKNRCKLYSTCRQGERAGRRQVWMKDVRRGLASAACAWWWGRPDGSASVSKGFARAADVTRPSISMDEYSSTLSLLLSLFFSFSFPCVYLTSSSSRARIILTFQA